jgi:CxxC-x17-CxxC domain-containing protein
LVPEIATLEETKEVLEAEPPETVPEKILYPAVCATCGIDIEVPFEPDASRPTFCKDCLRDYQRAVAIERQQQLEKAKRGADQRAPEQKSDENRRRSTEHRTYASTESPMKLSQTQHIEPKKFKALRRKPDINVSAVRALIDGARQEKENES